LQNSLFISLLQYDVGSNQIIPNINGMSKRVLMLSCQWITDWF